MKVCFPKNMIEDMTFIGIGHQKRLSYQKGEGELGRTDWIRTSDPTPPRGVRYQTALPSDSSLSNRL